MAKRQRKSSCGRCGSENVSCLDCARMMFPKPQRQVRDEYREWVKTKRCLACRQLGTDPAHMQAVGAFGSDFTCIPLCREHHSEQHTSGVPAFEAKYQINVWRVAHSLTVEWFTEDRQKVTAAY